MTEIAIIGAGKLGTNLGCALAKQGYRIAAISDKDISAAQESQQVIGQGIFTENNVNAARHAQGIMISVPDDVIEAVAEELAASDLHWQDRFVFHCSGLLTTKALKPLEDKGALVASLHPVQSFSQKKPEPKAFEDIFFGLEGKQEALGLAIKIVHQLGSHYFVLEAQSKPLYHTACSMASNFLATLLDATTDLLSQAGLTKSEASQILAPLVQGTLQNVKKFDARTALTGPIIRGDKKSVAKHLEVLQNQPEMRDLYITMARRTLQIVKQEKKISQEKFKALKLLLEGK